MSKPPYSGDEITRLLATIRVQSEIGMRTPTVDDEDDYSAVELRKGEWHYLMECVDWLRSKVEQRRKDASIDQMASFYAVSRKLESERRVGSKISEAEAIRRASNATGVNVGTIRSHYYAVKKAIEDPLDFPE